MEKNKRMLLIYIVTLFIWPFIISAILELVIAIARKCDVTIITENQGLLIVNLSVYIILLLGTFMLYGNEIKKEWEEAKTVKNTSFLLYGLGLWITNLVIDNIVAIFGTEISENQEIVNTLSSANYWVSLIIVVFIGPLVEEIIFRYIIMNHFEKKGKFIGVLISSILFGILHISTLNIGEFLMYFISGLYLGIIYYKTNNLIIAVRAHAFSNLINMILIGIILILL